MSMEEIKQSPLNKAKKDKFLLVFDIPPILKKYATTYNRNNRTVIPDMVQFSIYGTMVPEITIKGVETRWAGNTLYVSAHTKDSFPPVEVKFDIDSTYSNYWVIYQWLNLMHDEKKGIYNANRSEIDANFGDYQTDISIYGLDEYDNKRIKFTYTKAFPTTLDRIEYSYQNEGNSQLQSGFTFLFSQLHTELVDQNLFNVMP